MSKQDVEDTSLPILPGINKPIIYAH